MRYTAVAVQTESYNIWKRKTIDKNLERAMQLIEFSCTSTGTSTTGSQTTGYAPVKLITFPEFFLQGYTASADIKKYKEDILIQIPGKETEQLGRLAKKYRIYICGAALEEIEGWDHAVFNCAFIIGPEGYVIHKYHKFIPAVQWELSVSPHDLLDEYMQKFGKGKSVLETLFPVTDTEIGKIGTFICMDGHIPEISRALAMNGAEVLLRPTAFPEPLVYEPKNWWEIQNRARALENICYVIAPNSGGRKHADGDERHPRMGPKGFCPGDSMIVDFEGQIIGRTPYPGETIASGIIDLHSLRERRLEPARNFPTLLRNDVLAEVYKYPIYPPNKFTENSWTTPSQLSERSPDKLGVIERMLKKGIFTRP